MSRHRPWWRAALVLPVVAVLTAAGPAGPPTGPAARVLAAPAVSPASVDLTLAPGESATIAKTVHTPVVPPRPDIVLLVDGTGSMADAIASVKTNLSDITGQVRTAQPDSRFAVATYRDVLDGDRVFEVLQPLTPDLAAVQRGVNRLDTNGGLNSPGPSEDWINALFQVANGAAGQFRPGGSPIVVLVGDASSHDPSVRHTLPDAIDALQAAHARVLAVGLTTEIGDGLNGNGDNGKGYADDPLHDPNQATTVTEATGGTLLEGIDPTRVAEAIGGGLVSLPTTITHQAEDCAPGLSVVLDPADRTVRSGVDAGFTETVTARPDAPQGTTLTCAVQFAVTALPADGPDAEDLRETISVAVRDVTSPVVTVDDLIAVANHPGGVFVNYTVTAEDAVDGPLVATCTPRQGALFPVGTTTVTCTATDRAGNTGTDTAAVTVLPQPPPPSADLAVTARLVSRTAFIGGGPVRATFTVTNAGPDTATGVVVSVTTPRPANPAARTIGAQSGCTAARRCTLPPGTRVTVTLLVTYRAAAAGVVRATVTGTPGDLDTADNVAIVPLTVLQPVLRVTPRVGQPGQVLQARGTGFPPGSTVVLAWMSGITAAHRPIVVGRDGTFISQVLILRKDLLGVRVLRASGRGYAPVQVGCLVVPRSLAPPLLASGG